MGGSYVEACIKTDNGRLNGRQEKGKQSKLEGWVEALGIGFRVAVPGPSVQEHFRTGSSSAGEFMVEVNHSLTETSEEAQRGLMATYVPTDILAVYSEALIGTDYFEKNMLDVFCVCSLVAGTMWS